jgi:hypothetical protein
VATGTYGEVINHYSLLRMLEDEYGLPHDGAAATAAPITGVWTAGELRGRPARALPGRMRRPDRQQRPVLR